MRLLIILFLTASVPAANAANNAFIGVITSSGSVLVNGSSASVGTTLFSNDTVEAYEGAALIQFVNGDRLELLRAKATFSLEEQRLNIQFHTGLIRFNFKERDDTVIRAGRYRLRVPAESSRTIGGLSVNRKGQVAASVCKGELRATDDQETESHVVNSRKSLLVMNQAGLGTLERGENVLVDGAKSWTPDELKGQHIQVGKEIRSILGNDEHSLTIDGTWEGATGVHEYKIDQPPDTYSPRVTPITGMAVSGMANCMTPGPVHYFSPAGVTAGTALGLRVQEKSQSSRF